jgi:hypothetical protein
MQLCEKHNNTCFHRGHGVTYIYDNSISFQMISLRDIRFSRIAEGAMGKA